MTKGDEAEQSDKLARSGLAGHFEAVEVLREKNTAAYRSLAGRLSLSPSSTWMIGNSPRSDVNPALDAGFHAAYVRYHNTWILEEEELREPPPGQQLLICSNFAEAATHLLG